MASRIKMDMNKLTTNKAANLYKLRRPHLVIQTTCKYESTLPNLIVKLIIVTLSMVKAD